MNIYRFLLLFLFCVPVFAYAQKQRTFYVADSGNDTWPGTLEKPFASIHKAQHTVRLQKKRYPKDIFTVFIRKGTYHLSKSLVLDSLDSGKPGAPVTYSGYLNEEVYFSGGVSIPVKHAVPVSDPLILSRLVPGAEKRILQVNLRSLGIEDYGVIQPKGFGRAYTPAAMEVFCNQQAMRLARWPNDSLVPIGKVTDPGSIPRDGDFSGRGGQFTYDIQRPSRWSQAGDSWISGFFRYGYADDAVRMAEIDTLAKTITTAHETMYGFEGGKVFQRWFAFNLLEEIDEAGEYYIDRSSGILYFYPPDGRLETIELSINEQPLLALENVSYVRFRNIVFGSARGMGVYIEKGKSNIIDHCTFRNLGMVAISIGKGIKPFPLFQLTGTGAPASGTIGSLYGHLYDNPAFDREAGTDHLISNCTIYNTGAGGIILGGGNRMTLQKGNNQVVNCRIYDFNRIERSYKAAVNIDGVGNSIRHCEIFNCPGSAILLHGNDHLIEYNNIHHAVTDGDDMGAIYYGRDPGELGNKIRYNFFHHIGNEHGSIMAIYHDDGACGMEVTGNIFFKAGSKNIMIGGGNDNVYRNNIFIDCPLAFHLDNRLMGWAKGMITRQGLFEERLEAVNYRQPPYVHAYPSIARYFEDSPGLPKRNFIENNVFVHVKQIHNGRPEWSYLRKNASYTADPGFVNYEKMNFSLRPSSGVFKQLPGFQNIPFDKIGIQRGSR